MADPQEEFRALLRPAHWSPAREDRVLAALQGRRRKGTLYNVAAGSALVAVTLSLAIMWFAQGRNEGVEPGNRALVAHASPTTQPEPDALPAPASGPPPEATTTDAMDALPPRPAIRFDDGSKVVAWGQTSVHLLEQSATLATIELESGQAWFDLSASSTRLVEVRIADVRVHVLGTEFVVEEKQGAVFVWVQSGTARVSSNGEEVQLAANERGRFAAHDTTSNEGSAPPASSARAPSSHAATSALGSKSVTQLWSIADDARVEGNLDMAIDALDSLVAQYPDDARASLAAFTLGRVLLSAHKDPRDAARAFAQARTLAPRAPLAEDALSREIEALGLAGATREASERSALYERLFPQGRHTDRVRKQR